MLKLAPRSPDPATPTPAPAPQHPALAGRRQVRTHQVRTHQVRTRQARAVQEAWPALALLALIVLAAALRLPHLATNPGWDGDEGYNYNIALNLAHGHRQMFALSFLFVQHPPLFFALAAALFHLLGASMLSLRLLSVLFSLGTLALLLPLGRELAEGRTGTAIGLLAALAYAVLPVVALQNRFGYTYNGLAFWSVLALLAVLRYRRTGGRGALIVCGVATAAALTTDQEGIYLLPLLLLGLGRVPFRRRLGVLALALAGPALYVGAMALADHAALLFDVTHTAGRVTGGSIVAQVTTWLYSLADLMRVDPAIPLGLAGLALVPCRSARRVVLLLLVGMLLVILKVRDPNPLFRTAEPLLPLVCLGLGTAASLLLMRLARPARGVAVGRPGSVTSLTGTAGFQPASLRRQDAGGPGRYVSPDNSRALVGRTAPAVALTALILLAAVAAAYDARAAAAGFRTPLQGLLPRSTSAATTMAAWVNRRLRPGDVVLAMPQASWLFHARTAELLQAVAITGQASAFYPAGIPASRWVYDVHLEAARFLVVDDFTRAWIAQNAAERTLVRQARRTWRLVYARGEYQVYENPAHAT